MTNVHETNFNQFAEFLFNREYAPLPNSLAIDVDFQDDSVFSDFLYDLFSYGYKKKFDSVPGKDLNIKHFDTIKAYLRAIGVETVLHGYATNKLGEITDIKISFGSYTQGL
jgi:hypothetical protein